MSGNLRRAWDFITDEIWGPLADFSGREGAAAPPDLFIDLFVAADEFLSPRPTEIELEEASNDSDAARRRFCSLKGTDFASEYASVCFLEEARGVIADYEISGFEDFYRRLLSEFLRKFNLRYRLDKPFTLRFLLPGSFGNLYGELHRLNAGNVERHNLTMRMSMGASQSTDRENPPSVACDVPERLSIALVTFRCGVGRFFFKVRC